MRPPDPLVDAARRFLDDLMPILKEKCPGERDEPLELLGFPRWIPEPRRGPGPEEHLPRRYKAVPVSLTAEQQCAARVLGELRQAAIQPLADLDRALAADPVIGPRLDHEVSSSSRGGQTWQAASMIQQLVDRVIGVATLFNLPPPIRDAVTTQWAELLRRPSDQMNVIVALHEFHAPAVPIQLEPGLEIDELSEAEIASALALGAGRVGLMMDERSVSRVFGIRKSFESQLFIDGVPAVESEREMAVRREARQHAELVLLALRVFKAGRVGTSGSFEHSVSWGADIAPASGRFGSLFGWPAAEPYALADEEVMQFREFWFAFERVHAERAIAGALRRFGFAADRALPDDEIVDLMIAAESLFLSEMDEQYRGELRFRLSTRAGSLLGTTLEDRLRVFKFMRRAYDARSVVVHGGVPSEDNLRGLDSERSTVYAFADDLENVLRDALKMAIRLLASDQRFPPDWEELMFAVPGT